MRKQRTWRVGAPTILLLLPATRKSAGFCLTTVWYCLNLFKIHILATFARKNSNLSRSQRVKIGARKRIDTSLFVSKVESLTAKMYENPSEVPDSVKTRMRTVATIVEYLSTEEENDVVDSIVTPINTDAVKELLDFLNSDSREETAEELRENRGHLDQKKLLLEKLKSESDKRSSEERDLERTNGLVELVDLLYTPTTTNLKSKSMEIFQESEKEENLDERAPKVTIRRAHERRPSLVGLMDFLQAEPLPPTPKVQIENRTHAKLSLRKVSSGRNRGFRRITAVFTRSNAGDLEMQAPGVHHLGMSLKELCKISQSNVPVAVRLAVVHLQAKRVENVEGVFRLSANKDDLDAFVSTFDKSASYLAYYAIVVIISL